MDTHLMTKYRKVAPGDVQRGDYVADPVAAPRPCHHPPHRVVHVEGGHAFTLTDDEASGAWVLDGYEWVREVDTITVELERDAVEDYVNGVPGSSHRIHENFVEALAVEEQS